MEISVPSSLKKANVQDNTVVHTKLEENVVTIGENATIGHGAILHSCTIGKGVIVGIKAVILDDAVVGDEAIIAAGSVVGDRTVILPGTWPRESGQSKKEISEPHSGTFRLGIKATTNCGMNI